MRRTTPRGLTLLESMIAMVVLLVGALGLLTLNSTANRMNGDARRMTRATAIAQDLLNQVETWDYATDARLVNVRAANDSPLRHADGDFRFESSADPLRDELADHGEAELTPANFGGVPAAQLAEGGYQRFWNVAAPDDSNGNGVADGRRVAVIVRWPHGTTWRRIVLHGMAINPAGNR
jgi:prepilin-type N-terminal cleavage/methylation domain-containing protein